MTNNWIKTEDGLPEFEMDVLVYCFYQPIEPDEDGDEEQPIKGFYVAALQRIIKRKDSITAQWQSSETGEDISNVTHWMPLPSPPKV